MAKILPKIVKNTRKQKNCRLPTTTLYNIENYDKTGKWLFNDIMVKWFCNFSIILTTGVSTRFESLFYKILKYL